MEKPIKSCPNCFKKIWRQSKTCLKCIPRRLEDPVTRFFKRVRKTETCWLWIGGKLRRGYGQFHAFGEMQAHRVSYKIHKGNIGEGRVILHSCDTPSCVRPEHLFSGTMRDNVLDAVKKGRHIKGETMWKSKLTEPDVMKIKTLKNIHKDGEIAKLFNVTRSTISAIFRGETWKHVS